MVLPHNNPHHVAHLHRMEFPSLMDQCQVQAGVLCRANPHADLSRGKALLPMADPAVTLSLRKVMHPVPDGSLHQVSVPACPAHLVRFHHPGWSLDALPLYKGILNRCLCLSLANPRVGSGNFRCLQSRAA